MNTWLNKGWMAIAFAGWVGIALPAKADLAPPRPLPAPKPIIKDARGLDKAKEASAGKAKPEDKKGEDTATDAGSDAGTDAATAPITENEEAKKARAEKRAKRRAERKEKIKEAKAAMRAKVLAALKGKPMAQAMKEELKRHARRLARLERIKDLAEDASDTEVVQRADKLIDKENARHDKWLAKFDAKTQGGKEGAR